MHRQSCNPYREQGIILPLATVLLFVLFLIIALVIDAGNLYRSRVALQNVADSAALAGIGYIAMRGRSDFEQEANGGSVPASRLSDRRVSDYLRPKIQRIIDANMNNSGIPFDRAHPPRLNSRSEQYRSSPDASTAHTYTVEISARVRFFLMHLLPFDAFGFPSVGEDRLVTVRATARREIANVLVALDLSYSMRCPSEETGRDCTCLTVEGDGNCGADGELKVDRLVDAVRTFVKRFDLGDDNIAFSGFNSASLTFTTEDYMNMNIRMRQDNVDRLIEEIRERYEPSGFTNMCDALLEGFPRVQNLANGKPISVVIFSDGAPTGGTFYYANPTGAFIGQASLPHVNYTLQWIRDDYDVAGPSALVRRGTYPTGLSFGFNETAPPAGDIAGCSRTFEVTSAPGTQTAAANNAFSGCLRNLGFILPWDGAVAGAEYGPGGRGFERWREQYYNCAIHMTDSMRENQATVYTIGIGPPAASSLDPFSTTQPPGLDPYQNVDDAFRRKDFFLARLANDRTRAVLYPETQGQQRYPDFTYTVTDENGNIRPAKTYDDWSATADAREGVYLSTTNDALLSQLFEKIARRIQLGLIQ